jgi:DNA-binding XRE family transcriptional regulator
MQMFTPNGDAIRLRRKQRSRRMKSFGHEIGVSERTLRDIERHNKPIEELLAARIASSLKMDRADVVFATDGPRLVVTSAALVPPPAPVLAARGKQLVPRFDKDSARDIGSGEALFDLASGCGLTDILYQRQREVIASQPPDLGGVGMGWMSVARAVCSPAMSAA